MNDQKNTLLAIVLSAIVLIGWQIFFGMPQMEKQKQQAQQQHRPSRSRQHRAPTAAAGRPRRSRRTTPAPTPGAPGSMTREAALGAVAARADRDAAPRRLDRPQGRPHRRPRAGQVSRDGRSEVARRSCCSSPSGSPQPFYAEFGWSPPAGTALKLPGAGHGVAAAGRGAARRRPAGDAHLRQRRGPSNSAAPSRSTTSTCSRSRTRS